MELLKNIRKLGEETEGEVYLQLFDKYTGFFTEGEISLSYVQKCAEYLNSLNKEVIEDLCFRSIRYCNETLKLSNEKPMQFEKSHDVLKLIYPAILIIPYPENIDEPVVHLELNCKWEEEHGLEWIVRKNKVLYVGPFYGEDPWGDFSEKQDWNYA